MGLYWGLTMKQRDFMGLYWGLYGGLYGDELSTYGGFPKVMVDPPINGEFIYVYVMDNEQFEMDDDWGVPLFQETSI